MMIISGDTRLRKSIAALRERFIPSLVARVADERAGLDADIVAQQAAMNITAEMVSR